MLDILKLKEYEMPVGVAVSKGYILPEDAEILAFAKLRPNAKAYAYVYDGFVVEMTIVAPLNLSELQEIVKTYDPAIDHTEPWHD